MTHHCPTCGFQFKKRYNLARHFDSFPTHRIDTSTTTEQDGIQASSSTPSTYIQHVPTLPRDNEPASLIIQHENSHECPTCKIRFSRKDNIDRHIREAHNGEKRSRGAEAETQPPSPQEKIVKTSEESDQRAARIRQRIANFRERGPSVLSPNNPIKFFQSCFNYMVEDWRADRLPENVFDPAEILESMRPHLLELINNMLHRSKSIKIQVLLCVDFYRLMDDDGKKITGFFKHNFEIVLLTTDLEELLTNVFQRMLEKIATFQRESSGLAIQNICYLQLTKIEYNPFTTA